MTKRDKSFCRAWTRAYRKGLETKLITLEWLGRLRAPVPETYEPARHVEIPILPVDLLSIVTGYFPRMTPTPYGAQAPRSPYGLT